MAYGKIFPIRANELLVERFDKMVKELGAGSRSGYIRQLMIESVVKHETEKGIPACRERYELPVEAKIERSGGGSVECWEKVGEWNVI